MQTVELPLVGHVQPWQLAFIVTGLPGMVLALLILPFPEPPRHGLHGEARASWGELFTFIRSRWQVVLTLSLVFGGMNIVVGSIVKWAPAYMSRHFRMNPAEYGMALGLAESLPALAGLLAGGWIVDRWYASGRRDAHLTYYMWVLIPTAPIVFWGMISEKLGLFIASIALAKALTCNFLGIAAAQVQVISPASLRGRLSGLFFLMVVAFLGMTLGSLLPAVIANKFLHDPTRLGHGIAFTLAVFAPLAIVAILLGRRHVLAAIAAVDNN